MNVTFNAGKLEIELHDLLGCVSAETKLEMVESLSCDDDVIKHVADQIINKWTESCFSGGVQCVAVSDPKRGLDWAWREVARRSGEVAAREIARLEDAIRYKDARIAEALEENREIRHQLGLYRQ